MAQTSVLSKSMMNALRVLGSAQGRVRYSNVTLAADRGEDASVYWRAADQLIAAGLAESQRENGAHYVQLTYNGKRRYELEFVG